MKRIIVGLCQIIGSVKDENLISEAKKILNELTEPLKTQIAIAICDNWRHSAEPENEIFLWALEVVTEKARNATDDIIQTTD